MMDCNVTTNFLREWQRMCDAVGSCKNCKLWKNSLPCVNNMGMFKNETEKAIKIVQGWSDSHPSRKCSSYIDGKTPRCMGTKEIDVCSCGGDKSKCDFYPQGVQ